jgi:hypothetical protein
MERLNANGEQARMEHESMPNKHGSRPKTEWTHAMKAYTYTFNRMPIRTNSGWKSAYEMLHGKKPTLKHLRKWGMSCVVTKLVGVDKTNWGPKGREGIFMGYSGSHATGSYLVYIPETKRFVVSRNVKFNEGKCDDVIRAAQATIARMEEFEEGAAQMKKMVDHHTNSGPDEPPVNELSRMPLDHPRSSEETIDSINPETGTSEEIKQAGQTAVAGAKIVKKKPAKKKK